MKSMPRRERTSASPQAPSPQAHLLAVFCLLLGVALGYLFRASASPDPTNASAAPVNSDRPSAQPGRREGVKHVQHAALARVLDERLCALHARHEAARLVLDAHRRTIPFHGPRRNAGRAVDLGVPSA